MHYFFQSESEVVDSPSGYETESTSPSEYSGDEDKLGNNSSSSSSSDTDIDAAVTEYRKTAPVAAVSTIGGLDAGKIRSSSAGRMCPADKAAGWGKDVHVTCATHSWSFYLNKKLI